MSPAAGRWDLTMRKQFLLALPGAMAVVLLTACGPKTAASAPAGASPAGGSPVGDAALAGGATPAASLSLPALNVQLPPGTTADQVVCWIGNVTVNVPNGIAAPFVRAALKVRHDCATVPVPPGWGSSVPAPVPSLSSVP